MKTVVVVLILVVAVVGIVVTVMNLHYKVNTPVVVATKHIAVCSVQSSLNAAMHYRDLTPLSVVCALLREDWMR